MTLSRGGNPAPIPDLYLRGTGDKMEPRGTSATTTLILLSFRERCIYSSSFDGLDDLTIPFFRINLQTAEFTERIARAGISPPQARFLHKTTQTQKNANIYLSPEYGFKPKNPVFRRELYDSFNWFHHYT